MFRKTESWISARLVRVRKIVLPEKDAEFLMVTLFRKITELKPVANTTEAIAPLQFSNTELFEIDRED